MNITCIYSDYSNGRNELQTQIINQSMDNQLNERLNSPNLGKLEKLTIAEMIDIAGNGDTYQFRMFAAFFLNFFFAAFIQMGFPIIFQPAKFECPPGVVCTEQTACANNYPLSDDIRSVAFTFHLVCDRRMLLQTAFTAFLYGGFIGSLYYGEIIERRGRKYAVIESMLMMTGGIYVSILAGNITIFSIGVFFFNAGFRGFYNASLLSLTEVMSEVSRASIPMVLSIGWALGQICIAILAIFIIYWRAIFIVTVIPLTILTYYAYTFTKQSPRFLVVKHEYDKAIRVVEQIAMVNQRQFSGYQLQEEVTNNQKMMAYKKAMGGGEIVSRLKHHSYMSLFNYSSIRIRVLIVGGIWSIFSLSYFISANSQINFDRSITFNIALAGVVEIIAYFLSMLTSLNLGRVFVIKRLLIIAGVIHVCYFFIGPLNSYHGFGKFIVIIFDIGVRLTVSIGNTFLAIYAIELFPTSIRHFSLGMLGFITKLMYWLSTYFSDFWTYRHIHPNFILGCLFIASFFTCSKLRETQFNSFKDNLSEDGDGSMMCEMRADMV